MSSDTDMRKGYDPVTIAIYDRKKKVLITEPSLIAIDRQKNTVAAAGSDALKLIHTEEESTLVLCPLKQGRVADYILSQRMIRCMLQKASLVKPFAKPKIAVSVPGDSTEVERKALEDALYQSGAGNVLISQGTIADMDRSLPSAYNVLMEIAADEGEGQCGDEVWHEVNKGLMPAGRYHVKAAENLGPDFFVVLMESAGSRSVRLRFPKALAVRMLDKQVIPDTLYSAGELQKHRQNGFQNVIYQIENGGFGRHLKQSPLLLEARHYLIVVDDQVVEVLSSGEPDIAIQPN